MEFVTAIGKFYEEPRGMWNLTAKLHDLHRPYTRRFSTQSQMLLEVVDLRSEAGNQAQELCTTGELAELRGDPGEWARFLLCGAEEPRFLVRFTVFEEPQGAVVSCRSVDSDAFATAGSEAATCFESVEQLVEALNCAGLPGKEICSSRGKAYAVNSVQLHALRLEVRH